MVLWSFKIKICFHWWAVARWCHVAAPHHHVDQVGLGQHDDNVALVYLLRLHPLLRHLLRAKLNESKPSWGTYPTMVAELISGNVGCKRERQKIWPISNFLTTLHDVATSTWLFNDAESSASSRSFFFGNRGKFTFPRFTCSGSLYFKRKEKVPRQLVALCLVRGVAHNTCVFLPDQPDVSGCKSVAGYVVLHLRGWL